MKPKYLPIFSAAVTMIIAAILWQFMGWLPAALISIVIGTGTGEIMRRTPVEVVNHLKVTKVHLNIPVALALAVLAFLTATDKVANHTAVFIAAPLIALLVLVHFLQRDKKARVPLAKPARGTPADKSMVRAALGKGHCPDCGSKEFYEGPSGGICTNFECAGCGSKFNVGGGMGQIMIADRI